MKMANSRPAMRVLRGVLSLLFLVIPIVLRSTPAWSCGVPGPACATVSGADAVFVGTVADRTWERLSSKLSGRVYKVTAAVLIVPPTTNLRAAPQSTLFWWNVYIEGAPREPTSDSSRAVMLGRPEQLTLRWVFQNAGEHHALTLVPDDLQKGIRVAVTREDTQLPMSVKWESVGKLHFEGGEIALSPSGAAVLNAGEHVEWRCTVSLDGSEAWIPGRYELHFELSRALATVTVEKGSLNVGATGSMPLDIIEVNTPALRKKQLMRTAASLLAKQRFPEAVAAYRSLVAMHPDDSNLSWRLGFALIGNQEYKEGAARLERFLPLALQEKNITPYALAYAYVALNDDANAVRVLRFVVSERDIADKLQQSRDAVAAARRRRSF